MAQEIQFEKAMDKLEKIVEALETGNITLDDALKKYEEGVRLSRACQKQLTQVEKKIEILNQSMNAEPFDLRDAEEAPKKRSRKTKKTAASDEDDDEFLI